MSFLFFKFQCSSSHQLSFLSDVNPPMLYQVVWITGASRGIGILLNILSSLIISTILSFNRSRILLLICLCFMLNYKITVISFIWHLSYLLIFFVECRGGSCKTTCCFGSQAYYFCTGWSWVRESEERALWFAILHKNLH